MCAPARAALIEPGQGSTHGRGSPIDDERTPASEPDRTPVSTEHPRGRAAAFLRPPARVSYRRLHRGRDGDLERMVERVPCRASVDMFGLTMDDFVRRCARSCLSASSPTSPRRRGHLHVCAYCSFAGTASTGQGATWRSRWVMLPRRSPLIGPRPRVPTTMRSAPASLALSAVMSAAFPAIAE